MSQQKTEKRGWDKSPSLSIVFGLSSKTQWLSGRYCAEVERRNRFLMNDRFLSHSLLLYSTTASAISSAVIPAK